MRTRAQPGVRGGPAADSAGRGRAAVLGLLAGLQAAALGVAAVLLPVFVFWAAAGSQSAPLATARTGVDVWLAAHHTVFTTASGPIRLAPLGVSAIAAAACYWFSRRIGARVRPAGSPAAAHAGVVLGYATSCGVLAVLAGSVAARPHVETALLGGSLLAATCGAPVFWIEPGDHRWRHRLRAVAAGLGFPAAVATLLIAASLAVNLDRVRTLYEALDPGSMGALGLAVAHVAVFPVFITWALAWLAGPGFAIGAGTSVTSSEVVLGPMPALPMLAALPGPGQYPWWSVLAGGLVWVLGGVFAGRVLGGRYRRIAAAADGPTSAPERPVGRRGIAADVIGVTVLVAGLTGLLSWWSSGSLGAAALRDIGPVAWQVAASVAGYTMVGMSVAVSRWWVRAGRQ